jgi:hypothetical protein
MGAQNSICLLLRDRRENVMLLTKEDEKKIIISFNVGYSRGKVVINWVKNKECSFYLSSRWEHKSHMNVWFDAIEYVSRPLYIDTQ